MHLHSLGFRTLIDSTTDFERATRSSDSHAARHRRALRDARRRTGD